MTTKPQIFIVIYTTWHHVYKLAVNIQDSINKSGLAEATIYQVAETLPEEVLLKMHAPPKPQVPIITPEDLLKADAFLFGIPTRYGIMPAQFKTFWDATGQIWMKGGLQGKLAGTFFSTSGQHGGQETTALTFLTTLVHHGVIYVPLGYSTPLLSDNSEVIGGSPYGAGTLSGGDGSRQPSEKELQIATHQGKQFATVVAQFHRGRHSTI